jgi:hypothetical protein
MNGGAGGGVLSLMAARENSVTVLEKYLKENKAKLRKEEIHILQITILLLVAKSLAEI